MSVRHLCTTGVITMYDLIDTIMRDAIVYPVTTAADTDAIAAAGFFLGDYNV